MPSRDRSQPKRRRWPWWLASLAVVIVALYSGVWYWGAARLRVEAAEVLAGLEARGIHAECTDLEVSGYPLRFVVRCRRLTYQDDARAIAATTGQVAAVASLVRPLSPHIELTGPLRTSGASMVPLRIDWERMRAMTSLSWPLPGRFTLVSEGLSGRTDPNDDEPEHLFSAADARAELRPVEGDIDYNGRFSKLEIEPAAIGGHVLPPLDGMAEAVLKDGVALLRAGGAKSLRGQALDIGRLDISSGEAGVFVSGPVAVDADGLVDATLQIRFRNPRAVGALLAAAMPERKKQIEQGFSALALLGQAPVTLSVVKGRAALGFIPLGRIDSLP